jgi:HAD superfamily hydrolase (TIGR01509 family)
MIKAVIFDMDGLIADTESIESKALEKILREYGKTPHYQKNGLIHRIGLAGNETWIDIKNKYGITEDIDVLRTRKREIFETLIKEGFQSFDGLYELLDELKKNNFKLAVASNRFINHIYLILEELNIKEYFDTIIGPSETRKHKPHPDIYLETAKQLTIKPQECLALEDTEHGIQSAHSAGMKVIAIPNKFTKDNDFSKANMVVKSLQSVTMELINSL